MRDYDTHATAFGFQGLDHMEDKGVIPLGLGRDAALEAAELIVLGLIMPPLVQ